MRGVKLTLESFIERSNKLYNSKYDYTLIDFKDTITKVRIVCPIHGEFSQSPKSHLEGHQCAKCGHRSEKKRIHWEKNFPKEIDENATLGEVTKVEGTPNNRYGVIRDKARRKFKYLRGQACQICGYSKHIEFCHIKAISSFSDDTPINTINSKENIAVLCPNCHWEFDNGLLII